MATEPKYQLVASTLRREIADGIFAEGSLLTTEEELKRRFQVSRQTVRQAIALLEDDGLVVRRRGSGTYVKHGPRRHGETLTVGVVTTYITDYIFPSIVRGIEHVLSANGCMMNLSATYNRADHERMLLQRALEHGVDGLIIEGTKTALPNPNMALYRALKEKNIPFLLEGVRRLKEEDMDPFRLLVIGEGTQREHLEELSRELGLEDTVIFTGNIPNRELKYYLAASDLFLFASRSETQGIVIQEALAQGCPVVAVRATGVEDAVEDGRNGYLAPEDVDAWCLKVWKALEGPAVQEMRTRARASVRCCRSVLLAMQAEQMYRGCLEKRQKEVAGYVGGHRSGHVAERGEECAAVSFSRLFKST